MLATISTPSSSPCEGCADEPVEDAERAAREAEREEEDDGAEGVLAQQPGAAADAEGEAPVRGRVRPPR